MGAGGKMFIESGFPGLSGVSMRCVKDDHTAINLNLHYLENGTVMLNFIYQKELFFLPLGFALKVLVNEWTSVIACVMPVNSSGV